MTHDEMRDRMKALGDKMVKDMTYEDFHNLFTIMNRTATPTVCGHLCQFFHEDEHYGIRDDEPIRQEGR